MASVATPSDPATGFWPAARDHLVYAAIVAAYCLPYLAERDLFYRDESRYGAIVREMIESDSWFVLTMGGDFYSDKPPLFFSAVRLAAELAGTAAPFVFFVVVALSALFFVAASDAFLRAAGFDRRTVRAANLVLLAVPWIALHMQTVRMDLLFSGAILFSIACYARGMKRETANVLPLVGGLLAGLAVMVKGPFGAAIPILSAIAFAIATRHPRILLRADLLSSLAPMALPSLAWFASLYATFGERAFDLIVNEQIVKRVASGRDSSRPFWFYPLWLLGTLMPWLLLVPCLASARIRGVVFGGDARGDWTGPRPGLWLVLPCLVAASLALGAVAQKHIHYLLPLVPGLTVLVAIAYRRLDVGATILLDRFYAGLAIVLLAAPPAALWALGFAPANFQAEFAGFVRPETAHHLAAALSLTAIPLALAARLRGEARLFAGIVSVAIMVVAVKAILLPDLDRIYNPRHVAERFEPRLPAGQPILVYGIYEGSLSYHFDGPLAYVEDAEGMRAALAAPGAHYVITTVRRWEREPELWTGLAMLAESRLESTAITLLGPLSAP